MCRWAAVAVFLVFSCSGAFADRIIYVDDDATGANDGSSWVDAYKYLQDALADADSANKPVEIRVAQGIYRPDRSTAEPNDSGDRTATFRLINGVTVRGGYSGLTEANPDKSDIGKYETILSGDLAGNDVDVNDPNDLLDEPTRAENSLTIVRGSGTNTTAVLDGFIISGGNRNIAMLTGRGSPVGSGLHISSGKPIINNCTFLCNAGGGGICNDRSQALITNCSFEFNLIGMVNDHSNTTIAHCSFSKNRLAIRSAFSDSPRLIGCMFIENSGTHGGAIYNHRTNLTLNNCAFVGNMSHYSDSTWSGNGGAIFNNGGVLILTDCIFIENQAEDKGAGIYNLGYSVKLTNCTFASNISQVGMALAHESTSSSISNCILWDDGNEIWNNGTDIEINYSNIHGGHLSIYDPNGRLVWGKGNINQNPLFTDPYNGDYHLKSQAGRFDQNSRSWIQDDVTSPCIDSGDPNSPIGSEPFPNGGVINMGAYGGTAEASKSFFGGPVCETIITGDINGDCKVDFEDFRLMANHWLQEI